MDINFQNYQLVPIAKIVNNFGHTVSQSQDPIWLFPHIRNILSFQSVYCDPVFTSGSDSLQQEGSISQKFALGIYQDRFR